MNAAGEWKPAAFLSSEVFLKGLKQSFGNFQIPFSNSDFQLRFVAPVKIGTAGHNQIIPVREPPQIAFIESGVGGVDYFKTIKRASAPEKPGRIIPAP